MKKINQDPLHISPFNIFYKIENIQANIIIKQSTDNDFFSDLPRQNTYPDNPK